MKSVKCPECGFVGWADAERCKKCGVLRLADPDLDCYQPPQTYRDYQPSYRGNSDKKLKKGLAVASLVLGIFNLLTFGILGLGAIIGITLSIVAMSRAKRSPYEYGGSGLATAGLITSILSVTIIVPLGIVAAIAIPNVLASARAANESGSIATLRNIHEAEATYRSTVGNGAFGTLDQLVAEELVNPQLAKGFRYGYRFKVTVTPTGDDEAPAFEAVGVPLTYGKSGIRSFFVDETGVVRADDYQGAEATDLSPPLNADSFSRSSSSRRRNSSDGY
jgi:type II secretory pathway pseudopilin PulG